MLYTDPSAIHRRDCLSPPEPASSLEICESGRIAIESGWGGRGGASQTVVVYVTNERPFLLIRTYAQQKKKIGGKKNGAGYRHGTERSFISLVARDAVLLAPTRLGFARRFR